MRSKLFWSCVWAKKGTPGAVLGTSTITCQHHAWALKLPMCTLLGCTIANSLTHRGANSTH